MVSPFLFRFFCFLASRLEIETEKSRWRSFDKIFGHILGAQAVKSFMNSETVAMRMASGLCGYDLLDLFLNSAHGLTFIRAVIAGKNGITSWSEFEDHVHLGGGTFGDVFKAKQKISRQEFRFIFQSLMSIFILCVCVCVCM